MNGLTGLNQEAPGSTTAQHSGYKPLVIVTIVRFPAASPVSLIEARERFGGNAASYLDVPGLLWKAYLRSEDGCHLGGVYWWADRASAEAKYNEGWLAGMIDKYGAPPEIEWFDAPVVVDPLAGAVRVDAPPKGNIN